MGKRTLLLTTLAGFAAFWAVSAFAKSGNIDPASIPEDEPLPGVDFGLLDTLMSAVDWKRNEYEKYASAIADAEMRHGIPQDLLARLLYQESHFRSDIITGEKRSAVGARGIAQFMPATAREFGMTVNDSQDDRLDPFMSIEKAAQYIVNLHRMFGEWKWALAAYNWGPGNMRKYLRGEINPRTGTAYQLPEETATYIAQVSSDIPSIA